MLAADCVISYLPQCSPTACYSCSSPKKTSLFQRSTATDPRYWSNSSKDCRQPGERRQAQLAEPKRRYPARWRPRAPPRARQPCRQRATKRQTQSPPETPPGRWRLMQANCSPPAKLKSPPPAAGKCWTRCLPIAPGTMAGQARLSEPRHNPGKWWNAWATTSCVSRQAAVSAIACNACPNSPPATAPCQ